MSTQPAISSSSTKSFVITGLQRSGTTLLSKLLGNHPEVFMEQQVITFRLLTCFKNQYQLLPHNLAIPQEKFLHWLVQSDEKGRLAQQLPFASFQSASSLRTTVQQAITNKLKREQKKVWGDKCPNLQHFIGDLQLLLPDTKVIHIIRDGRANAYSLATRGYQHLLLAAQQWVDGNIQGLVNQQYLGKKHYHLVHYEQLLQRPEKTLEELCDFLDLPYHQEMLTRLAEGEVPEQRRYVKSYLDQSKINKWQEQLSPKQIRQIERIQGPLLKKLGYTLQNNSNESSHYKPLPLSRQIYYRQMQNFRQLFHGKRQGMRAGKNISLKIPFRQRLYQFIRFFIKDFFSDKIFRRLFSHLFYREKYYQETTDKAPSTFPLTTKL